MSRKLMLVFALWLSVLAAPCAGALTPEEVIVVANSNSPASLQVADYYLKARNIPSGNLVLIKTTTEYEVSPSDYESQIRLPLIEAVKERGLADKTRCICLVYGVPVRVGTVSAPPVRYNPFEIDIARAHHRLYADYLFLTSVGNSFPAPRTDGLAPVGKLFADIPASQPEKLDPPATIQKTIESMLASKQKDLDRLADPDKRQIALRQILGLQQDVYGLQGLIRYIERQYTNSQAMTKGYHEQLEQFRRQRDDLSGKPLTPDVIKARADLAEKIGGLTEVLALTAATASAPATPGRVANIAVDSDLSMLLWSDSDVTKFRNALPKYAVAQDRTPNPLGHQIKGAIWAWPKVFLAARIDGPSREDALRIIRDSVAVEKTGLHGVFYIDAGVRKIGENPPQAIISYDANLKKLYSFLVANTKLQVVLDEQEALFPAGSCPNAAMYVGWYSLSNYVPAFSWQRGAVGWHVASFEAMHLRDPASKEWCSQMIQGGVDGTLGAVAEPFLGAFPLPQEFFPLLLTGKWTIAECYWRTVPWISWRMTLIADPLYNPFAANPQVRVEVLPTGLAIP